jgi:hypothetical protein
MCFHEKTGLRVPCGCWSTARLPERFYLSNFRSLRCFGNYEDSITVNCYTSAFFDVSEDKMKLRHLHLAVVLVLSATTLYAQRVQPLTFSKRADQRFACSAEPRHTPFPDLWTEYPGEFRAEMVVQKDGGIGEVRVVKTTYAPDETESAVKTVRSWRFEPATKNGYPVSLRMNLVITTTKNSEKITFAFGFPKGQRGCVPFPMPTY